MLIPEYTNQFKRDSKLSKRRCKDLDFLNQVMKKIQRLEQLEEKLKDHSLTGPWKGHRELHLEPDWLLIYKIDMVNKKVIFVRNGSHSDLF